MGTFFNGKPNGNKQLHSNAVSANDGFDSNFAFNKYSNERHIKNRSSAYYLSIACTVCKLHYNRCPGTHFTWNVVPCGNIALRQWE